MVECCLRVKAAGLCSCDELDRTADGKTEIAVRPPLIDGNFGKPVGVLIPESCAWRQITEGPRAVQNPTHRGEPCAGRQRSRPQPGHRVAVVIDVNDLAQVIRPVCPTICAIVTWPAGGRITARQHGCHRGEEVAPVKAGREMLRLPVDVPAARLLSSAQDQLKQAVAGANIPAAVRLEKYGWPRPADAGIDNAEKDVSCRVLLFPSG